MVAKKATALIEVVRKDLLVQQVGKMPKRHNFDLLFVPPTAVTACALLFGLAHVSPGDRVNFGRNVLLNRLACVTMALFQAFF